MAQTRGIYIVGTDTGVGKTIIAAALVWALRRRGLDVGVMKPVETGVRGQASSDALLLRRVAGISDPLADISPYRLPAPLAPFVAAQRQRTRISLATIMQRYRRLARRHDVVIVEGVGGLMVPLAVQKISPRPPFSKGGWGDFRDMPVGRRPMRTTITTTLDLAQALGLPLVLVIGNRLGAINHALLTVEAAKARGLRFIGGVINQTSRERDAAVRTNPQVLQDLLAFRRWAVVSYGPRRSALWESIGKRLEQAGFLEKLTGATRR